MPEDWDAWADHEMAACGSVDHLPVRPGTARPASGRPRYRDDPAAMTDADRAEVDAFRRFLAAAGPAPPASRTVERDDGSVATSLRLHVEIPAGWLPYALGTGPAPPPELEDEHPTAWTLPG